MNEFDNNNSYECQSEYLDGRLYSRGQFINLKKEGVWEYYYSDGSIIKTGRYINDKMSGEWSYYFSQRVMYAKRFYI